MSDSNPAPSTRAADFNTRVAPLVAPLLVYFQRRLSEHQDAADCLAETVIALWGAKRPLPATDESLRAYTFGIARNVLAAHRRGALRQRQLAEDLRAEISTRPHFPVSEPDDLATAALSRLGRLDRELVELVVWDSMAVGEAGAVLGLSPAAARKRYQRARARLRSLLIAESHDLEEFFGSPDSASVVNSS